MYLVTDLVGMLFIVYASVTTSINYVLLVCDFDCIFLFICDVVKQNLALDLAFFLLQSQRGLHLCVVPSLETCLRTPGWTKTEDATLLGGKSISEKYHVIQLLSRDDCLPTIVTTISNFGSGS